jgi:hypothetical protein
MKIYHKRVDQRNLPAKYRKTVLNENAQTIIVRKKSYYYFHKTPRLRNAV